MKFAKNSRFDGNKFLEKKFILNKKFHEKKKRDRSF